MGGGITTGGVDVLCFVGLEGADVETSLMPLLLLLLCLGVVVVIMGKGEGERLLLVLPLDEVEDADDIFSIVVTVLLTVTPVVSTQAFIAGVCVSGGGDLFGIEDVDVADVTTTEDEVNEFVVVDVLLLFAGCRITNVAEDCEDLAVGFCCFTITLLPSILIGVVESSLPSFIISS